MSSPVNGAYIYSIAKITRALARRLLDGGCDIALARLPASAQLDDSASLGGIS